MPEGFYHVSGKHEGKQEDLTRSNRTRTRTDPQGEAGDEATPDLQASSVGRPADNIARVEDSLQKLTFEASADEPEAGPAAPPSPPQQPVGLLITNLPFRVRWQDLKDLCRTAAPVIRAEVALESDGRSRGFGEVFVASMVDANKIQQLLDGYDWQGRRIRVTIADSTYLSPVTGGVNAGSGGPSLVPQQGVVPPMGITVPTDELDQRTVFVGNLPWNIQWQDLKDLLRPAGRILRADVSIAPDGRSRGWGTALFATEQEAQAAIDRFHNVEVNGRRIRLRKDRLGVRNAPGLAPRFTSTMPPPPSLPPPPGH